MGKFKLFFRIFVLSSGLFINTSCEFIYRENCIRAIRSELGLSEDEETPYKLSDYCNCGAKLESEGYSAERAAKECEYCLNE